MNSDEHLSAFMGGFEFALVALEGRLKGTDLDPEERERLMGLLRDYRRIVDAYMATRKLKTTPPPQILAVLGPRAN